MTRGGARRDGAEPRQAPLRRAAPAHHRGRHPRRAGRRPLRGAGRRAEGRRGWVVRLYFNPLVRLIWIGAIVMALGGALSLSDRRLRIGAPRRARRRRAARPRSEVDAYATPAAISASPSRGRTVRRGLARLTGGHFDTCATRGANSLGAPGRGGFDARAGDTPTRCIRHSAGCRVRRDASDSRAKPRRMARHPRCRAKMRLRQLGLDTWRRQRGNLPGRALSAIRRPRPPLLAGAWAPAHAVEPGEMLKDPALEARARHISPGAALPRLPEPVDRRQQRRARPRPAPARARAPRRRRQRRRRARASSRPATASSSCCARACSWHTLAALADPAAAPRRRRHRRSSATPADACRRQAPTPDAAPLSPAEQQRLDDAR